MTRPNVSILVGSGFSVPEGVASVRDLNKRLCKIKEDEILIHSDLTAIFLNGQVDHNRDMKRDERLFVEEFLEFYNDKVLKPQEMFHYETFYDYYSGYLTKEENKEEIDSFCNSFNVKYGDTLLFEKAPYNRVDDFNSTFNQLLASLLHNKKYFEEKILTQYPLYDSFIRFLKEVLKTSDIKFHTLNHDLFFDWLGSSHVDLQEHYADGFELDNSPYYGSVLKKVEDVTGDGHVNYKNHKVQLEIFANKYDKPLSLFKLHGSIFNVILHLHDLNQTLRVKKKYGVGGFCKVTVSPETGEKDYKTLLDDISPDFLSGTTNKIRYYTRDSYYVNLLEHFENNLSSSDLLYVIGYGFQDTGINEYLETNFLSKGKKMIVIDPYKPKTYLIDKYNAIFINKGITEVSSEELLSHFHEVVIP